MIIIISIIVILILILVFYSKIDSFQNNKKGDIEYYDFLPKNNNINKSILIISGVHGNEPAGSVILHKLINNGYFYNKAQQNNIYIRVIPSVNKWGLSHNLRFQPNIFFPDINRNFKGYGLDKTSKTIIQLIKDFDVILDFHEGWGFHQISPESVGSTISPGNTKLSVYLAEKSIHRLNQKINEPLKKFMVLYNRSCVIPQTLACHCKKQNVHYLLIETSGQNNVQPLEIRTDQIHDIIDECLNRLN